MSDPHDVLKALKAACIRPGWFGKTTLSIENGQIKHIVFEQGVKPHELVDAHKKKVDK